MLENPLPDLEPEKIIHPAPNKTLKKKNKKQKKISFQSLLIKKLKKLVSKNKNFTHNSCDTWFYINKKNANKEMFIPQKERSQFFKKFDWNTFAGYPQCNIFYHPEPIT